MTWIPWQSKYNVEKTNTWSHFFRGIVRKCWSKNGSRSEAWQKKKHLKMEQFLLYWQQKVKMLMFFFAKTDQQIKQDSQARVCVGQNLDTVQSLTWPWTPQWTKTFHRLKHEAICSRATQFGPKLGQSTREWSKRLFQTKASLLKFSCKTSEWTWCTEPVTSAKYVYIYNSTKAMASMVILSWLKSNTR